MKDIRLHASLLVTVAVAIGLGCESTPPTAAASRIRPGEYSASVDPSPAAHIAWDILSSGSATAADGLSITITGEGTFVAPAGNGGTSGATTGGGTWQTKDVSNTVTGSGSYRVTGLVRWERAPVTSPSDPGSTGGLAILRIEYDDGSAGTLTVSCRIAPTPPGRFEGITATKGFVDYWNRVTAATIFHGLD